MQSPVSCAIYRRDGRHGLKLWVESSSNFPSPAKLDDDSLTYRIFNRVQVRENDRLELCTRSASILELLTQRPEDELNPVKSELAADLIPETTSWLSIVICFPSYPRNTKSKVPSLIIRLLTTRRSDFLGGIFTSTDETIVRQIASYFSDLLPGLLFQEAAAEVNKQSLVLQGKIRDRIARSEILLREREFAALIRNTVPNVQDVYVAERSEADGAETTSYWSIEGKASTQRLSFNWQTISRFEPLSAASKVLPEINDSILDISLFEIDGKATGLRCFLNHRSLCEYEWQVIEYVVGELRFAALGAFDISEKTIQIAELRHALRAGLTGLLGHLKVATEIFIGSNQAYREGIPQVATRRVFEEAQFRKSLERARLSGEQINAFFEDTRVLLADITKNRCRNLHLISGR